MPNTFELSAQMILFADAKGRGAAKLITPAYNIGQKISQYEKLKLKYEAKLAEEIDASTKEHISAIAKASSDLKTKAEATDATWTSVGLDILLDPKNYKDLADYTGADNTARQNDQKEKMSKFNTAIKPIVSLYAGVTRIKEDIKKGFSNLKSDTQTIINKKDQQKDVNGTQVDAYPDIKAVIDANIDKFYKNESGTKTGALHELIKMEYPTNSFNAFKSALANIQDDAQNGDITFSLLTAKKTQGDSVIKTERPITIKKTTIVKSFDLDTSGTFVKAIPDITKLDLLMDFDSGEAKFGVEANFGDDFIANGKKDIFYINQGIVTFIRNVNQEEK